MKFLYWRPRKLSRVALTLVAVGSLLSLLIVERSPVATPQRWYADKLAAAQTAREAMEVIRLERLLRGHQFDAERDPAQSGLIGEPESVTTSVSGNLQSKQTSINPNFAAVTVEMLKDAGVEEGDCVAVGYSGSFPAINVCVLAALKTLGCRPLIIASASGSQYGANRPDLLWIEMERLIEESGVIRFRSHAVSLGGNEDQALAMTAAGREVIRRSILKNGLPLIDERSFEAALEARMSIYEQLAGGVPIKAYINVGGGTVSVGRSVGKKSLDPGLNLTPPPDQAQVDSVMSRFLHAGTPVIHFVEIKQLAERYGLPIAPQEIPVAGVSPVHVRYRGNRLLAAVTIGIILLTTHLLVLRGMGSSLLTRWRPRSPNRRELESESTPHLELMV